MSTATNSAKFPAELAHLEGFVLSEGVVVDSRPVSFAVRMLSGTIDAVTQLLALWAIGVAISVAARWQPSMFGEDVAGVWTIIMIVSALVILPVTVETLSRGRSLGKLALGIRVVRDDGGPIRFRHALIRGLTAVLELWMTAGVVALTVSFFNNKGKRLGDLLAGTYATRVRGGKWDVSPLVMPPHLAMWARNADIRPLPAGYALAARQFLARASRLTPAARHQLGQELAGLLEPFAAPGPPVGTHPEEFLAAVLAERRDRDLQFAQRQRVIADQRHAQRTRLPFGLSG